MSTEKNTKPLSDPKDSLADDHRPEMDDLKGEAILREPKPAQQRHYRRLIARGAVALLLWIFLLGWLGELYVFERDFFLHMPPYSFGQRLNLSEKGRLIFVNWGAPEDESQSSDSDAAKILLHLGDVDTDQSYKLLIKASPVYPDNQEPISVGVNSQFIGQSDFKSGHAIWEFSGAVLKKDAINYIELKIPYAETPGNGDLRRSSIAFQELSIIPSTDFFKEEEGH